MERTAFGIEARDRARRTDQRQEWRNSAEQALANSDSRGVHSTFLAFHRSSTFCLISAQVPAGPARHTAVAAQSTLRPQKSVDSARNWVL